MTKAEQEWSLIEALVYCKGKRLTKKSCAGCPYAGAGCAIDATIAKLKAQEPIVPVKVNRYMDTDENGDWFSPETYDCGNCGVELHGKANYCHLCGRAVKWG